MAGRPSGARPFALDALLAADGCSSDRDLARRLGITHTAIQMARARGGLSERKADEWACKLNLHPGDVWGRLWWELAA